MTLTHGGMVSILSPVFNESRYVTDMLNSVRDQTHQDFELIVVDDGSTDNTAELVRTACRADPRIKLISEGKLGKVRAFNRAFEEARGDIIVLLGGDDMLPRDSLELRVRATVDRQRSDEERIAVFARLRTFSENPRFDGQVIPRSPRRGSRSGGALTMSRPLGETIFPIPAELISEDLWLGSAAEFASDKVVDLDAVVLHYRIHPGNSNPRHENFSVMNDSMHKRMAAYAALAAQRRFPLDPKTRNYFNALCMLEDYRYRGRLLKILLYPRVPFTERLRAISMAHPNLYALRMRLFKFFSGR